MTSTPVALVTGASRGIGLATAQALVADGHQVVITARKPEALADAARAITTSSAAVIPVAGNSSDADHRHAAVATALDRFGRLDVLVNNAGINPMVGDLATFDLDAFRKILEVNLLGSLAWVQEAYAQWMGAHGGSIVNVSSVSGVQPQPVIGAYGVSKAALLHMTEQLASELGPAGIRVNAVAPAVVRTRFGAPLFERDEAAVAAAYPLGRIGEPEDVAQAIAFLASARSSWITGQTLVLDGGLLSRGSIDLA
jgi:NAD(P)-dependent dehydrogenase (short-subunit alcohol dehydrogenase family)